MLICVSDVSFPSQQFALPAQSVAAHGRAGAVREGFRATPVGDVHSGSQQGVHHVQAGLRRSRSPVCPLVTFSDRSRRA